uniref:Uncharacterized protein n=1 Tax=Amphimedon queenslandica TaxID=400682 RepID=A0A1X7SZ70_AMPQE
MHRLIRGIRNKPMVVTWGRGSKGVAKVTKISGGIPLLPHVYVLLPSLSFSLLFIFLLLKGQYAHQHGKTSQDPATKREGSPRRQRDTEKKEEGCSQDSN